MVKSMQELRRKGQGDVKLKVEGRWMQVHQPILAGSSDYWAAASSGTWGNKRELDLDSEEKEFFTYSAVDFIIKFLYQEENLWDMLEPSAYEADEPLSDIEKTNNNKLFQLLDIHRIADYWRITHLTNLMSSYILKFFDRFVRPDNVVLVLNKSRRANARKVSRWVWGFRRDHHIPLNKDEEDTEEDDTFDPEYPEGPMSIRYECFVNEYRACETDEERKKYRVAWGY